MAQMQDVTISVQDSPIPTTLDQYYSFLKELIQPTSDQKIALNSTLVTFDIVPDAKLYNQGIFRSFADRTIKQSPSKYGLGSADFADLFSYQYSEVMKRALMKMDASLDQAARDKIDAEDREIAAAQKNLDNVYRDMGDRWSKHKRDEGITDKDPYILDKMIAFYNSFGFSSQIRRFKSDIGTRLDNIERLREAAYPDDDTRMLAQYFRYADSPEYQMARPIDWRLERDRKYDEVQLAQMWIYNNIGVGAFEIGSEIIPSGTLEFFLTNSGKRSYMVKKEASGTFEHDREWGVNGTARSWVFFSARVETSVSTKVKEAITKVNSIEIGFENIAEYWVRRGRWFSSAIFEYKAVKDILKKNPRISSNLRYAITSLVLGRGMYIKYFFKEDVDYDSLTRVQASGSSSFSVFGLNIPTGGATYSGRDHTHIINKTEKSVTFQDSGAHCRLLAFRVEDMQSPELTALLGLDNLEWSSDHPDPLVKALYAGQIGQKQFDLLREKRSPQDLIAMAHGKPVLKLPIF